MAASGAGGADARGDLHLAEVSRLRTLVASLEGDRDMRVKLEKLLEVQGVQVDLQKELRVKTESLLQVEQQMTAQLRHQLDRSRRTPGEEPQNWRHLEERLAQAQDHIRALERQLAQAAAPAPGERSEALLRAQIEEQERMIRSLQQAQQAGGGPAAPEGEVVRLQLLLQHRERQQDELSETLRLAQNDAAEAKAEADTLRYQTLTLKKEVTGRSDERDRQQGAERDLRAEIFRLQAKLEQLGQEHMEESRRSGQYAEQAALAEERRRDVQRLGQQLAEEQTTTRREREQLAAEADFRLHAKEQAIRNQTGIIEALNRELKEKQAEIDRLFRSGGQEVVAVAGGRQERGGVTLPPLMPPASPRSGGGGEEELPSQRSIEGLHRQLRSKDVKIAKQTERLNTLTEMLEKRDQQLDELSSARRDRQQMQTKVSELEETMRTQPRIVTHTEAERKIIEQEQRLRDSERQMRDLSENLKQERIEKDDLSRELRGLRGTVATGASSTNALHEEQDRMSRELAEVRRQLDARTEELRRAREKLAAAPAEAEHIPAVLPAMQKKLVKLEELDRTLSRDVAVHLQERENKIENLNSTVALLRSALDEARRGRPVSGQGPAAGLPVIPASPRAVSSATAAHLSVETQLPGDRPGSAGAQSTAHSAGAQSPSRQPAQRGEPSRDRHSPLGGDPAAAARDIPSPVPPHSRGTDGAPRRGSFGRGTGRAREAAEAPHGGGANSPDSFIGDNLDLGGLSAEDLRNELLARRRETGNLEAQLGEKQQLVLRLIEEANLCNAEVASLQQTVQQAVKDAKRQAREHANVCDERDDLDRMSKSLQQTLADKEQKVSKMLTAHQEETSGNAATDELDRAVAWKLKTMPPRLHEIRTSMFLVLNRHVAHGAIDKKALAHGLASTFALSAERIEIVEDTLIPRPGGDADNGAFSIEDREGFGGHEDDQQSLRDDDEPAEATGASHCGAEEDTSRKRDLVLVNIVDQEVDEEGHVCPSVISAADVIQQVRSDLIRGQKLNHVDSMAIDVVFFNHGDMVIPYEWPTSQARLLLREGRLLAGKHAVITVHEVRDPYILRVVAYDTEAGREFILYLHTRDIMLLLDSRDGEATAQAAAEAGGGPGHVHLDGLVAREFRSIGTVADPMLLDIVVSSLSFSVWRTQQILVASEMRIPWSKPFDSGLAKSGRGALTEATRRVGGATGGPQATPVCKPSESIELSEDVHQTLQPAILPDVGLTRGFRPPSRSSRLLYEDVIGFEGRPCVFSLTHTTTSDLREDMLRARLYYPKTCNHVEACLPQPMLSDRLRIVAEVGSISEDELLSVAIVVEEIIYPPAFVIRLTSVSLDDAYKMSPAEEAKPHVHIIRVTKDTTSVLHCPDISFAVSPSTARKKLLRCIGVSSAVEGPRETLISMPSLDSVIAKDSKGRYKKRTVTGHVMAASGLRIQLLGDQTKSKPKAILDGSAGTNGYPADSDIKRGEMTDEIRAQLRAKHGKGRLLVRHGRMVAVRCEGYDASSIRAVVSVHERANPYRHFVMSAYEPQTSREWELLADSIDIFKMFFDRDDPKSVAMDLANPASRQLIAEALVDAVELADNHEELMLIMPPEKVRELFRKSRDQAALALAGGGSTSALTSEGSAKKRSTAQVEQFEVIPAITRNQVSAVGGFTGGNGDRDRLHQVEQRLSDRLFTGHKRLNPTGRGPGEPYKIHIYDNPRLTSLHSYVVIATPVLSSPLLAQSLPVALRGGAGGEADPKKPERYMMKVDDKALESFLWDSKLLEPSRQEELLHYICQSIHLDADRADQPRLNLRKHKLRTHQLQDTIAQVGENGVVAPAVLSSMAQPSQDSKSNREIGGSFPLNRLKVRVTQGSIPRGPSLTDHGKEGGLVGLFSREWTKVHCMAQRFGSATVIITVSRRGFTYKLAVYEPESSALYEMCLVTSNSQTPLNLVMERCDLAGRLDLVMLMHETPFPHQVTINLIHVGTTQEFNLKIGDDLVFTMLENSRRDAFMLFLDQLISWGCIGFQAEAGREEEATAEVWEETFAGNQIFDRAIVDDILQNNLHAEAGEGGELKMPAAIAPKPDRLRVPVIRTHLDTLGRKPPTTTVQMQLLYHGEQKVPGDAASTVLMRVHRRSATNDIAITLRTRTREGLSLPQLPWRLASVNASSANGRPFETPALSAGEAASQAYEETTIWLQDKCARTPCGAFGEICEVPGIDQQVFVLISDEDSPRAVRIAVALAQMPFTVLFQVVLLETSEPTAKIDSQRTQGTGRRVLQQAFQKHFALKRAPTSGALKHLANAAAAARDRDVRQRLDEITAQDEPAEHLGSQGGTGKGGPKEELQRDDDADEVVDTAVLNISTRQKIGRMMVFSVFRDLIGHNMYLRVVMHDPVSKKDCHLTLLHYTTQRLLTILRINRDMLEECTEMESDEARSDRQRLRAELGKLIFDNVYLVRQDDKEGLQEFLDEAEEDEDVDYELRMHDIMIPSNAALLTVKRRLLETPSGSPPTPAGDEGRGELDPMQPKSLLQMAEENLIYKLDKVICGRRVLIAFYNETTKEDILRYSHNIRVVVACMLSLDVLYAKDYHEEALELFCAANDKRHLMSSTREADLVQEMANRVILKNAGQRITGIKFGGLE